MEVKINREIRNYTESMFFGLSMRQFLFSLLACGVAVGLYFLLRSYMGTETVSWMCVLGAAPFAALGFVRYHGMNAEQFVWAFIKSEVLVSKRLVFHPENLYYEILKAGIESCSLPAKRKKKKEKENKEAMFLEYSELLNSFDSVATTKITISNRRLNRQVGIHL